MRQANVVHLLWKNVSQGTVRFLFRPHGTWSAEGRPLLAPLTKKVQVGDARDADEALDRTIEALNREDLREPLPLSRLRRLAPRSLELCSPARGVQTRYCVTAVTAYCPADLRDYLADSLGGARWLTRSEALRDPALSPTGRLALEAVFATPTGPIAPEALTGDWKRRMLHARDHDSRAFGPLFEDMRPYLRQQLNRLVVRAAECEEVLAEACLHAFANLDAYVETWSPATWVGRILKNRAISRMRVQQNRGASSSEGILEVADSSLTPAEAVEEAEELARGRALLHEQLTKLNPVQRRAWQLRHEDGLDYKDISESLNIKIGTLATWFHRVRANLERQQGERGR